MVVCSVVHINEGVYSKISAGETQTRICIKIRVRLKNKVCAAIVRLWRAGQNSISTSGFTLAYTCEKYSQSFRTLKHKQALQYHRFGKTDKGDVLP